MGAVSDIDLTAAVEAAARRLVWAESAGNCEYGRVCPLCDCFASSDGGAMRDGYARDHAGAAVAAAAPLIEAAVREKVAREIDEQIARTVGVEPRARMAMRRAASISRGGAR